MEKEAKDIRRRVSWKETAFLLQKELQSAKSEISRMENSYRRHEDGLRYIFSQFDPGIEAAPAIILTICQDRWRVEMVNSSFETILKIPRNRILGRNAGRLISFVHKRDQKFVKEIFSRCLSSQTIVSEYIRLCTGWGEIRNFQIKVLSLLSGNGWKGIMVSAHDLTEFEALKDKIRTDQIVLRHLANRLAEQGESVKRQIASNLHDGFGQTLFFTNLKVKEIISLTHNRTIVNKLEAIVSALDTAAQELHEMLYELSIPILFELGLKPAFEWLCEWMHKNHSFHVDLVFNGEMPAVAHEILTLIYNSTRELVLNSCKHSGGNSAVIHASSTKTQFSCFVLDRGRGFAQPRDPGLGNQIKGIGLLLIAERVRSKGGSFQIDTYPGMGARIAYTIPFSGSSG